MPLVDLDSIMTTPRIAEIMVVRSAASAPVEFIQAICPHIERERTDLVWGQLQATEDLQLFLYGLSIRSPFENFAWDLVAHKILGFVLLFDWHHESACQEIKDLIDFILHKSAAPIICVADVGNQPILYREEIYRPPIVLSRRCRFTFCQSSQPATIRRAVVALLDMLLNEVG